MGRHINPNIFPKNTIILSFSRLTIELDKEKLISNKHKEDSKKLLEDLTSLQEMYDKTSMELVKTKDIEVKLKEDYERASYDLEMCRERYGDRMRETF